MFHGFDFDATMLRIAAMNLMLHGVDDPDIHYQDTLSAGFTESSRRQPPMALTSFWPTRLSRGARLGRCSLRRCSVR